MTTEESLQLIDQLAEFPTKPMLVLTGGDPFKRRDIYRLVEHAAWSGLHVSLTPSATPLVTREAILQLRDAGVSRLAISIDGADAETHDATRGVFGSFDRNLQILEDAGALDLSMQVNTTITPFNVGQIDRMAELLAHHEIDMWSVFFLVPVGRGASLPRLSADQCEAAFGRICQLSHRQRPAPARSVCRV